MNLAEKNVLVVGTGISGIAACELLLDKKIRVTLFDGNKDLDLEKVYEKSEKLRIKRKKSAANGSAFLLRESEFYSAEYPKLLTKASMCWPALHRGHSRES